MGGKRCKVRVRKVEGKWRKRLSGDPGEGNLLSVVHSVEGE